MSSTLRLAAPPAPASAAEVRAAAPAAARPAASLLAGRELLRRALRIFGLESLAEAEEAPAEVVALAERRRAAREARDFAQADRLRAEIEATGWEVRDEPGGYRLVLRR